MWCKWLAARSKNLYLKHISWGCMVHYWIHLSNLNGHWNFVFIWCFPCNNFPCQYIFPTYGPTWIFIQMCYIPSLRDDQGDRFTFKYFTLFSSSFSIYKLVFIFHRLLSLIIICSIVCHVQIWKEKKSTCEWTACACSNSCEKICKKILYYIATTLNILQQYLVIWDVRWFTDDGYLFGVRWVHGFLNYLEKGWYYILVA